MRAFFSALLFLAFAQPVLAAKLALVIGNSEYTYLEDLRNPVTDGEGYRDALTELGYEVSFHTDLDRFGMENAIIDFADRIRDGDEAFVVFSGHGWSDGSVNYLLATDSPLSGSERKLKRYSFALKNGYDGLLDELAIQGARLQVAVVDACRDNPFKPPEGAKSLGLGRGLSRVQPPEGAFVIFSAGAGQVALDRLPSDKAEERFSVFTRNFLPLLNSGLTLEDAVSVAQTQTAELAAQVGHRQSPSYYDETLGKTCLADSCHDLIELAALNAAKPSQCDLLYEEAKTLDGCFAFESYLANCADHAFASIAENYVARQCTQVEAEPEPDPEELARIAEVQRCDALYQEAKELGACFAYETYTKDCADHAFFGMAQGYLDQQCKAPEPEPQPDPVELARLAEAQRCDALYQEAKDVGACFAYESYAASCETHAFASIAQGFLDRECRAPEVALDPEAQALVDIRRCDTLAASPFDPARPSGVPGVNYEDLQTETALVACQTASLSSPDEPRISFTLGRVLEASGDLSEAQAFYRVGAVHGYAAAHTALGRLARDAKGDDRDIDLAIRHFSSAAELGDPVAMTHLSKIYELDGGLARQDFRRALDNIEQAAAMNHPHAFRELGRIYKKGTLYPKDLLKSFENYQRAAMLGDPSSHYEVGVIYIEGIRGHFDPDAVKARDHLQIAAEMGNVQAMARLGAMYLNGNTSADPTKSVEVDIARARFWYAQAALGGSTNSQMTLGKMFEHGSHGTEVDFAEALGWYELAAQQDFLAALLKVAVLYEGAEGIPADPARSAEFWVRAAELGAKSRVRDRKGWKRPVAMEVQRLLKAKGLYKGAIDGAIGSGTRKAMNALEARFNRLNRFDTKANVIEVANFGWECQC